MAFTHGSQMPQFQSSQLSLEHMQLLAAISVSQQQARCAAAHFDQNLTQITPVRKKRKKEKKHSEQKNFLKQSQMLTDMPLHLFHIQSGNIAQSQTVT